MIISDGRASCFRLPGLRVAGVRAGRQDRPAAQRLAEDVVVLPWDRAGGSLARELVNSTITRQIARDSRRPVHR